MKMLMINKDKGRRAEPKPTFTSTASKTQPFMTHQKNCENKNRS